MKRGEHKVWRWLTSVRDVMLRPVSRAPFFFVFLLLLFGLGYVLQVAHNLVIGNNMGLWKGLSSLGVVTLVVYLLTCLVARFKWAKPVCYALALLLKFVVQFVKYNFMADFSPVMLQAIVETNGSEAGEFVGLYAFSAGTVKAYLYIAVCVVVILCGERWLPRVKHWFAKGWERWLLAVLLLLLLPYGAVQVVKQAWLFRPTVEVGEIYAYYRYGPTDPLSTLTNAVLTVRQVDKDADKEYAVTERAMRQRGLCEETDTLHLVVVIGESYIKRHAGVYGYSLPTTPRLSAEREAGNLFLLEDVIAPFNTTSESLKQVLSTNHEASGERWCDYPFFPALFKQAGYYVTYWDNQWDAGKVDIFDFSLGSITHSSHMRRYSYDLENDHRYNYDEELIDSYKQAAHGKVMAQRLSLSMFHLMGQHMAASSRYPDKAAFKRFSAAHVPSGGRWLTQSKREEIAHYDNATYYNDYVLGRLLDLLRGSCAVLVYFSDHGEEMYDVRDFTGRDEGGSAPPEAMELQYGVPMMVWCSDAFQARYPEQVERLRAAANRKASLDDLPQLLMNLGRVRNSYYRAEHDVLSPKYKEGKRLVRGGVDYDATVSRVKN